MMRTLLLLFFCLGGALGMAQTTFIPDNNFEQALIDQNYDDVLDNEVLTANIENITFLNLTGVLTLVESFTAPGLGITDLTGIKDFVNLEVLWVQQNDLTVLDLEGMTSVRDVRAFFNELEQINIKGLTNLEIIGLNVNELKAIDVSTNTSLNTFDIAQNNLEFLDVSGLGNLTAMNVEDNPLLTCIQVESVVRANALNINAAFRKNGGTAFGASCATTFTRFPDRNFETYLIDNNIDTEGGIPNGLVRTADLANELSLNISNQAITDLTGLEAFSNLEILDVGNNNLNALRLQNVSLVEIYANNTNVPGDEIFFQNITSGSNLTNVTTLELQNNNLGNASSTFSFGGVPNVQTLNVSGNNFGTIILGGQTDNISNLIASNCPNLNTLTGLGSLSQLQELTIDNSNFTALDFSGLDLLSTLRVNNNDFESLNLKDIDDTLTTLNTTGNLRLSCIEVNSVANAEAQGGWQKDATTEYLVDCNAPQPFTVAANLEGAGASPNFEITEGNFFTLNFNADATAVDGTQYTPIVQFSLNGNGTTEDFTFNGNAALPNAPFTVGPTNPDGNITILAVNDSEVEGDEIYTITLSSPDPSLFTITGENSFEVTVKDIPVNTNESLTISATLNNAGEGPYYDAKEGDVLDLEFKTLNGVQGETYGLRVVIETFLLVKETTFLSLPDDPDAQIETPTIRRSLQNIGDVTLSETSEFIYFTSNPNNTNGDGTIQLTIEDDDINEDVEELIITLSPLSENVSLDQSRFVVKIKDNDKATIDVSLENAGNPGNYSVLEGEAFTIRGNIVGANEGTLKLKLLNESINATINNDFNSYAIGTGFDGQEIEITVNESENFDDFSITVNTVVDGESEGTEKIILKLIPAEGDIQWAGADNSESLVFEIDIIDRNLEINDVITGVAEVSENVYEISEGQEFSLKLEPVGTEQISYEWPLELSTFLNGQEENFDIKLDEGSFGYYEFTVIQDGITDPGETYTITLPPPTGNYAYANSNNPDGSLTLSFRIIDVPYNDIKRDYLIQMQGVSFDQESEQSNIRTLDFENGAYSINDNERLIISLTSENGADDTLGLEVISVDGSAIFNVDYSTFNDINQNLTYATNFSSSIDLFNFEIETLDSGESNKTFELEITPTTDTYNLIAPDGTDAPYLQTFRIPFEIVNSGRNPQQEIIVSAIGGILNAGDNDAITETYNVKEGNTFTLKLSAKKPVSKQDAQYNMQFRIEETSSTMVEGVDFNISITNSQGQDMGNSLANYTVNSNSEFDALITIEILEDEENETPENLVFELIPDVVFDKSAFAVDAIAELNTFFQGTVFGDSKRYQLIVTEGDENTFITASLSNTGGTEGALEPDIITCSLLDAQGKLYTDLQNTISIAYEFSPFRTTGLSLKADEFNPVPEQRVFVFNPGQATSSIEVRYPHETGDDSQNDTDCDYYYLTLQNSESAKNNGITVDKRPYTVKIADNSEWLIFVDLDISNDKIIRPVVRNLHPGNNYLDNQPRVRIESFEIEEGNESQLKFIIDAAKPVKEGKAYTLNMNDFGSTAVFNSDYAYPGPGGDDFETKPFTVLKDREDGEILFDIITDNDNDEETIKISFQEPKGETGYRFSKKDSRSYDQSYEIKILEALPVSVTKRGNTPINEELPLESFAEFVFTVDRSNEKPGTEKTLEIAFDLEGSTAEFFDGIPDFTIESNNQFFLNETSKSGILIIDSDETEGILKIIPVNDERPENNEIVQLKILDDFGYRPSATQGEESITITDSDQADYIVSFKNTISTLFESPTNLNEEEITITLEKPNTTGEPIPVTIQLPLSQENSARLNDDYEIFLLVDGEEIKVENVTDFVLNIPDTELEASFVIKVKEDFDFDEDDETFNLVISEDGDYGRGDISEFTVTIKNKAEDGTSSITLFAEVISSSCEDKENGRILVSNQSEYTFKALLYKDGEKVDESELPPSSTDNFGSNTFQELELGEYTVNLTYEGSQSLPQDFIPPSFELTIREPTDAVLINSIADKNFKVAKFTMSGSNSYTVLRNGELFTFETGTPMPTTLEVPMIFGKNIFEIRGEKDCQDAIMTSLFLNTAQSYPNPTTDIVYVAGFFNVNKVKTKVIELTGRTVVNSQDLNVNNGVLQVDLSTLSPGVYLLQVETPNQQTIDLKVVKQ